MVRTGSPTAPAAALLARQAMEAAARGDAAAALALWQRVLAASPDHPGALLSLGEAARRAGDEATARRMLSHAVAVAPNLLPARCALANLLLHTGSEAEAGTHLEVARRLGPDQAYVWRDTGLFRRITGDAAGALEAFERCLALAPGDMSAALGRSLSLLRLGRWAEGFASYRHRWSVSARPPRHQSIPPWQGEPPAGRRILVWDEQGAGDTIMCARLTRPLIEAGAVVVLEMPGALAPLFTDGRHGRVLVRGEPPPAVDFQVPLLDLPGLLGLTPQTIPWTGPYLAPDPERVAAWAPHLPRRHGRPRIGFSWAGNPAHPGDRWRTPGLAPLRPLLACQGADWYALQVASGHAELAATPLPGPVTDLAPRITGWADSAAILSHLDLLITPDSALAHLAGAMGRPVWTLIATDTDWRWLEGSAKTPWYPSMRLFRQQRCGDWAGLIARLRTALPVTA